MKIKAIVILLITSVIICGCTNNSIESPSQIARQYADDILYCFDNNDISKLKALFCESIANSHDLDTEIQEAFEFFNGKIVSKGKSIGMSEGGVLKENGKISKQTVHPNLLNIVTDNGSEYSIYFCAYLVYENHDENIGITYINIFNSENEKISIGADII
ncbi:MAG: DUF5104 domain-containing protein [Ruminococcus sp.]|nr:DUF5104 domain-containing protein [Ruminococcus sp.]